MFKFKLPHGTVLSINNPTGTRQVIVVGADGDFYSPLPPLALMGLSTDPAPTGEPAKLPVSWDGKTFPLDGSLHNVSHVYDGVMAMEVTTKAAEEGDAYAKHVIEELRLAEEMLSAREKLGLGGVAKAVVAAAMDVAAGDATTGADL